MGPFVLHYRDNQSDIKTYKEVIGENVYQKYGMKILSGEKWMDCGGNVGAFTILASKLGAKVTCYEPDPVLCKIIEINLKANNLNAEIKNAALVHNDTKFAKLFFGFNNQSWRNTLFKKSRGSDSVKVNCLNFFQESESFDCCKMDIEGAEMPILENNEKVFDKLVYEWSFDIDRSLERFWNVYDKQVKQYKKIKVEKEKATNVIERKHNYWQANWFPMCTNVYCFKG